MVDKWGIFVVFFFGIFLISSVSANFNVGNPKNFLETFYGPSDNVTGAINISFSSEPLNSIFSDSRGNSANLSEVLKNNPGYPYSCSPTDCKDDYSLSNPSQTKTVTLNSGDSKIYAVKLTGNIFKIDSFKFALDSTAVASCTNQIGVDFLDDSFLDVRNNKVLNSAICSNKDYGCFNSGVTSEEPKIDATPFCQKVNLSSSPGFSIGAWIKKVSGVSTITASIYDINGGSALASCVLPDATSSGGEVSCNVNYSSVEPKQYYVCIQSTNGNGNYTTKGYSITNGCGFHGTPPRSLTNVAYQIFSQGNQFGPVGTLQINKSMDGRDFAGMAEDYLIRKYGSLDCSSGCVIPIRIDSNSNQSITLRNLQVDYEKDIGTVTENNFYEVSKTPARINSTFQKLYLDGSGFSVPSNFGNFTFSLQLDGQNILSQMMEVKDVPIIKSVTPTKTASAYPTEFIANVASSYNLTGFSWDFGDNTSQITTSGNNVSHIYSSIGVYNLKLKVTDKRQLSSTKTFMINVSSPKDLINLTLNEKAIDISNLEREISSFSPIYQDAINSSLNISYLQDRINLLQTIYQNATSEDEYNAIVTDLVGLKIPAGISRSRNAQNIALLPVPSYVNLNVLQDIGGGTFDTNKEQDYTNAVSLWQKDNLDVNFDFNEFSGRYPGYTEPITKVFEIRVSEKKDIPNDYYFILPEPDGFMTDAQFSRQSGYIYINLKGQKSFSFSTTGNVDFTNLPAFISPAISGLTIATTLPEVKNTSKWIIFSIAVVALLVIAFIIYIIMQQWYKRRYENYLFKNRNDLYNMVNYVNNARRKGLKNNQIEENLKKVGWSSEKIRYVMRKYSGKRTGMFEIIPFKKLAENAWEKSDHTKFNKPF